MLTPQEVQERRFPIVRLQKGYEVGSVDEFLDQLTEDYSALHQENAVLKGKMKALVQYISQQARRVRELELELEDRAAAEPVRLTVLPAVEPEEAADEEPELTEEPESSQSEDAAEEMEPVEV